jgi:hypothetical protein
LVTICPRVSFWCKDLDFCTKNVPSIIDIVICKKSPLHRYSLIFGQMLGDSLETGPRGPLKNDQEAPRLYKLTADQGNADGQVNLGGAVSHRTALTRKDLA